MDEQEAFENCFLHFIDALRVLSLEAETQCTEMDSYNTPREIQDDVVAGGLGSLRLSASYLSWEQSLSIVDLVAALRRLPPEALSVPHLTMTDKVGCITAMCHPAWDPLRRSAQELLTLLEAEIERNKSYFGRGA